MITIELPERIEKRFEELASKAGKTTELCAKEAIMAYLEDLEDYQDAMETLSDIKAGKTKTVRLEEVMKDYGLEH
jgi:RHH-type rel operon transcriptional repressor/antitoxin RelB